MRILIVDDEPDIRFIIGMNLDRWGHRWSEAEDAGAAYAACLEDPPDAILLDVSMPGESGLELLTRLRDDGVFSGPVALLSAAFPGQLGAVAAGEGIRHLAKPFGLEELQGLIAQLARDVTGV